MITLSGYEIKEELYAGEKSIVYRAVKDANTAEADKPNIPVILKVLQNEYPEPAELNAFRQEYETLEKIESPRIVKTLGLEKYKNSFVIVFEDTGGEALSLILPEIRKFPLTELLELMI